MFFRKICRVFFTALPLIFVVSHLAFADASDCDDGDDPERYKQCIAQKESGGNPAIANTRGYLGLYQLGMAAMIEAGFCEYVPPAMQTQPGILQHDEPKHKKGEIVSMQAFSNCTLTSKAKSMGITQITCCGNNAYMDCADKSCNNAFLSNSANSVAAQNAAADAYDQKVDALTKKYEQYCGETVNGIKVTRSTLRSLYHLKGGDSLKAFFSGGEVSDGYGTSNVSYTACIMSCMQNDGKLGKCSLEYQGICSKAKTGL